MFIAFEGIDGCGKTTVSKLFFEKLKEKGEKSIWTNEPNSDTEFGLDIRNLLKKHETKLDVLTEFLLFYASRVEHLNNVIIPALKRGETVVCDRYIDSSFAYQGASGLSEIIMRDIHDGVFYNFRLKKKKDLVYPNIVFWIDTDIDTCMSRSKKTDAKDMMSREYYEKCRRHYEDVYRLRYNFPVFCKIDGNKPIDEVLDEVISSYKTIKNLKGSYLK